MKISISKDEDVFSTFQNNLRYYNGLHDNAQKQFDASLVWDDLLSVINNDMAETQSSTLTWMASTCHDKVKSDMISEIVKYLSTNNSGIRTGISTSTQMKSNETVQVWPYLKSI